jgi:hypothetical protein
MVQVPARAIQIGLVRHHCTFQCCKSRATVSHNFFHFFNRRIRKFTILPGEDVALPVETMSHGGIVGPMSPPGVTGKRKVPNLCHGMSHCIILQMLIELCQ